LSLGSVVSLQAGKVEEKEGAQFLGKILGGSIRGTKKMGCKRGLASSEKLTDAKCGQSHGEAGEGRCQEGQNGGGS